jgi:thymidylate kinase
MSARPDFCVVSGPDHAGKSSALRELTAGGLALPIVSVDRAHLGPGHLLLERLHGAIVADVGTALGQAYSPDFLTALSQTLVIHMRDRIQRMSGRPILVDSYYYKTLAKCRMAGAAENPMFDWWRSFPQPRRVIYLDVAPGTAWERARRENSAHPLECYGSDVGREGFETYQRDLGKLIQEEIADLPVTVIREQRNAVHTARAIREVLDDEYA